MRALALLLAVAVPSIGLAQHKTVLDSPVTDPAFEQPVTKRLLLPAPADLRLEDEKPSPLLSRWYFWVGAATAVTVLAAILAGVAVALHHDTSPALTASNFRCATGASAGGCDGFINAPPP